MAHPASGAFVPLPPGTGSGHSVVSQEVAFLPPLCSAQGCQRSLFPPFASGTRCELCEAVGQLREAALQLDRESFVAEAVVETSLALARLARGTVAVGEDVRLAGVPLAQNGY